MAENEYSRARLDGALINIVPDMPLREVMESGAFKQAVAGDTMSAREPYKPEFSFTPIAGHVMSVNHLPKVADDSWGFRRRFLTVPFTVTIPEERQDQGLAGRIIDQELEGVVNLCIEAFRLLLEERKYTTANSERQLLTEWIYDGDIVSQWVTALDDKECRLTSFEGKDETFDNWVAASRLYAAYADWCKTNNFKPFGSNKWATKLATFSRCTYKKTRDGRFWKIAALPL
jgi:putative DNA primase/helicase